MTEIILRSIFAFFLLFILARIMGKKQISQLTFFDYVVGISFGTMTGSLAIDQSLPIRNAVIGLLTFVIFGLIFGIFSVKSIFLRKVIGGKPTILIENGEILEKNLAKVRLTTDDLMLGLRQKNAFNISDVEAAILETNGKISVMKKAHKQPVTARDIGLNVGSTMNPSIVIIDGHLLEKRLTFLGYTKEWLEAEIVKQGANSLKDVFLAQIDSNGSLYIDLIDEEGQSKKIDQKGILSAQLRKVQADLESFAEETNNQQAKQMYDEQSKELDKIIKLINPYLKG